MPDVLQSWTTMGPGSHGGSATSAEYQTRDQPCFVGCFATYHWPWTSTKSDVLSGSNCHVTVPFLGSRCGHSSS